MSSTCKGRDAPPVSMTLAAVFTSESKKGRDDVTDNRAASGPRRRSVRSRHVLEDHEFGQRSRENATIHDVLGRDSRR